MATSLGEHCCALRSALYRTRLVRRLAEIAVVAIAFLAYAQFSVAQAASEFHRTLAVASSETVTLEVELLSGDLQVSYGRDGEVSITAFAKSSASTDLGGNFFASVLAVEQEGNHVSLRPVPHADFSGKGVSVSYRIDVPYRTELTSTLLRGKQNIGGILGPVKAVTDKGDITAAYISKGLHVQVDNGDLNIQVVGEHVDAKTGSGNISCSRLPQGVSAETGDGDITLVVVGPSTANVKKGSGRIEVGGARGSLVSSTDRGDLHIKAVPHEDWQLNSGSGSIRLELPAATPFELEASTGSGEFQFDRDDIARTEVGALQLHQMVNGGGKRIAVHTESGKIAIR
ncbi:MAG TPA: DUF4097 family beta strand repeat-containing protein [Candidatus Sulfotelmatobacter sp.]|nr:DUF4097 family beta strand repeat-containing protein [Candidatus Sulfotelmatobacter sp.]